jgi:peptide deformylase
MTLPLPNPRHQALRKRLAALGIRQAGDPVLRQVAHPVVLPDEMSEAEAVFARMDAVLEAVRDVHQFKMGVGIAAPQIGVSLRLALVQMPGRFPVRLLNPRVIATSRKETLEYEGCLSFFDYRGRVRRPWSVQVETLDLHGKPVTQTFEGPAARLVMHELDHLDGRLYVDLMLDAADLIDIADYAGERWHG